MLDTNAMIDWFAERDNFRKFNLPTPNVTKTSIYKERVKELKDKFDIEIGVEAVKNKWFQLFNQYKTAKEMRQATGQGDLDNPEDIDDENSDDEHEISLRLESRILDACPFFYQVDTVWGESFKGNSPPQIEPRIEPPAHLSRAQSQLESINQTTSILSANNNSSSTTDWSYGGGNGKRKKNDEFMDIFRGLSGNAGEAWKHQEETKRQQAIEETRRIEAKLKAGMLELEVKSNQRAKELDPGVGKAQGHGA